MFSIIHKTHLLNIYIVGERVERHTHLVKVEGQWKGRVVFMRHDDVLNAFQERAVSLTTKQQQQQQKPHLQLQIKGGKLSKQAN